MIVKRDGKWCLVSKETGKTLGCHETEQGAIDQEKAIRAQGFALNETFDVKDVEIFSVGEWNGEVFTDEDLDNIVTAFDATKDLLKPFLKLGHGEAQNLLRDDELPAMGWLENVRKIGNKLMADFSRVPAKIKDLIVSGAYRRVSAEIFENITLGGVKYPLALKAVAILGGDTPAVSTLSDIVELFGKEYTTIKAYDTKAEYRRFDLERSALKENDMDLKEQLAKALARIAELEVDIKKFDKHEDDELEKMKKLLAQKTGDFDELKKKFDALTKKNSELEAAVAKHASETDEAEVKATIDGLVNEGQVAPAQKEVLHALLAGASKTADKKFSVGEKEYSSRRELILDFVKSGSGVDLEEEQETNAGKASRKGGDNSELAEKAEKYAEKHKVSISEATVEVSRGE